MNYQPVTACNQSNPSAGFQDKFDAEKAEEESDQQYMLFPVWSSGSGPTWLFDIDSLTKTMNYQLITAGNQSNPSASFQDKFDAKKAKEEIDQQYVLFPVWSFGSTNPHNTDGDAAFDGKELKFDEK
nr:hypothetical protein [Tanacetum cinerariifolium]